MTNEQREKMINRITLRWKSLIQWLAEERLAHERAKLRAK